MAIKKLRRSTRIGEATGKRASSWRALFRLALMQSGLFSARQADELGFSQRQLTRYVQSGKLERVQRALYRIPEVPPGQHDDLIAVWLWARNEGVISHETALYLHELSNVLPSKAHITVPMSWRRRTIRIPADIVIHHDDLLPSDRGWIGPLPTTTVRRTLSDCLRGSLSPELVEQAFAQAAARGLINSKETVTASSVSFFRGRTS